MAKLVRVARDDSAVIIEKSDGWYSVVDSKSKIIGSADSLDALVAGGNWRKPVPGDSDKFRSTTIALDEENSPSRAVRVPSQVKELIKSAAKVEPNKRNVPFLLKFASQDSVTVSDVARLSTIIDEAKRHAEVFTTDDTVSWINKIIDPEPLIAAASFESSDELEYFGVGHTEGSTEISELYALNEEGDLLQWTGTEFIEVDTPADEFEAPVVIEVDDDTATALANWIEDGREGGTLDISTVDEDEFALVAAAYAEMDLEELSRLSAIVADATGYSAPERSNNATRQKRSGDGKFNGEQIPQGTELTSFNKARLPQEREVILDPARRIEEYSAAVKNNKTDNAEEAAVESEDDPAPLYFAIVDDVDRTAVLSMVAVRVEDDITKAFVRDSGDWVEDQAILDEIRSATPPAVVEIDDEDLIREILAEVDAYDSGNPIIDEEPVEDEESEEAPVAASAAEFKDYSTEKREEYAKKGFALPDGSFPIADAGDLQDAIQAYGRSKDEDRSKVRNHIRKRARALNRTDLVPSDWSETAVSDLMTAKDESSPLYDPFGVLIAAGIPGIADTPSDWAAVRRLKNYWKYGKGGAKIRWPQHDGNLTRCHRHLAKYLGSDDAWGYCNNLHKELFGFPNPESGGR